MENNEGIEIVKNVLLANIETYNFLIDQELDKSVINVLEQAKNGNEIAVQILKQDGFN